MSEAQLKAFDFAESATKQLITLATGFIALTITFYEKFGGSDASVCFTGMIVSWIALGVSVLFGVWTLLALTGNLGDGKIADNDRTIYTSNVRLPSIIQIIAFVVGLAAAIYHGILLVRA